MATIETRMASTSIKDADSKIRSDLATLEGKITECKVLLSTKSLEDAETKAVIGFLEASAPRMVALAEVAAMGAVSEDVLMECLAMNDTLQNSLKEIETAFTESTATASAAAAAPTDQFGDLLLDGNQEDGSAMFTIDDDDEDDAKPAAKDDSFDDFLKERTAS